MTFDSGPRVRVVADHLTSQETRSIVQGPFVSRPVAHFDCEQPPMPYPIQLCKRHGGIPQGEIAQRDEARPWDTSLRLWSRWHLRPVGARVELKTRACTSGISSTGLQVDCGSLEQRDGSVLSRERHTEHLSLMEPTWTKPCATSITSCHYLSGNAARIALASGIEPP